MRDLEWPPRKSEARTTPLPRPRLSEEQHWGGGKGRLVRQPREPLTPPPHLFQVRWTQASWGQGWPQAPQNLLVSPTDIMALSLGSSASRDRLWAVSRGQRSSVPKREDWPDDLRSLLLSGFQHCLIV